MAVWPGEALRTGKGGEATIRCRVTAAGSVTDCVVLSESPNGAGFGAAAIMLSTQLKMRPATRDGQPVDSVTGVTVKFPSFAPLSEGSIRQGRIPDDDNVRTVLPLSWLVSAPSLDEVIAAYPEKAKASGAAVRVSLVCHVTNAGGVARCTVLDAEPKGVDGPAAARSLVSRFAVRTSGPNGERPKAPVIQIPFVFLPQMLGGRESAPVGKPNWISLPTAEDMKAALPVGASGGGRALLDCRVAGDGRVEDCRIESEAPTAVGYGDAALKVAPKLRLSVWTNEGLPIVGGRVRVPLRFAPQAAPAAPAP